MIWVTPPGLTDRQNPRSPIGSVGVQLTSSIHTLVRVQLRCSLSSKVIRQLDIRPVCTIPLGVREVSSIHNHWVPECSAHLVPVLCHVVKHNVLHEIFTVCIVLQYPCKHPETHAEHSSPRAIEPWSRVHTVYLRRVVAWSVRQQPEFRNVLTRCSKREHTDRSEVLYILLSDVIHILKPVVVDSWEACCLRIHVLTDQPCRFICLHSCVSLHCNSQLL